MWKRLLRDELDSALDSLVEARIEDSLSRISKWRHEGQDWNEIMLKVNIGELLSMAAWDARIKTPSMIAEQAND